MPLKPRLGECVGRRNLPELGEATLDDSRLTPRVQLIVAEENRVARFDDRDLISERQQRRPDVAAQDCVSTQEIDQAEQAKILEQRERWSDRPFPRGERIAPVHRGRLSAGHRRAAASREVRSGEARPTLAHQIDRLPRRPAAVDPARENASLEDAAEWIPGHVILTEGGVEDE